MRSTAGRHHRLPQSLRNTGSGMAQVGFGLPGGEGTCFDAHGIGHFTWGLLRLTAPPMPLNYSLTTMNRLERGTLHSHNHQGGDYRSHTAYSFNSMSQVPPPLDPLSNSFHVPSSKFPPDRLR